MKTSISVLIVEDMDEVREGLARFVQSSDGLDVVGEYDCAEDALKGYQKGKANVALVDIKLPGMSGIELIRKLRDEDREIEIMMLTVLDDDRRVFESIKAGAGGYLLKTASEDEIVRGIRELHDGGAVMSGRIARRVLNFLRPEPDRDVEEAGITHREWEILELLAAGHSYNGIAKELSISAHTVRSHLHHIYEKLHVKTRAEAVRKVRKSLSP